MSSYRCPKCATVSEAGNSLASQSVTCPVCGNVCAAPAARPKATFLGSPANKGVLFGLIVGYPLSYFFQAGLFRAMIPFGTYIIGIGTIFSKPEFAVTAVVAWIGSAIVFGVAGAVVGAIRKGSK